MKEYRNLIAMIFAPAFASIASVGFLMAAVGFGWSFNQTDIWGTILSDTSLSYLGFFLVGVPIARRWRHSASFGFAKLITLGVFAGAIIFSTFDLMLVLLVNSSPTFPADSLVWGGGLGAAVALSYGLIAGTGNLNA